MKLLDQVRRRLRTQRYAASTEQCERYGIPVPTVQPQRSPTRSVRRRQRRAAKEKETPPAPEHPPEVGSKPVP